MTRGEAIRVLEMFLHKQCDLERTKFAYDTNTVWEAVYTASKALEQEPREGEWQLTDDEMFIYCPFCHETEYERPIDASWKYCPDCGARLD